MQRLGRMKHELTMLKSAAMTGISVWTVDDNIFHLEAQIVGGDDSPYKGGIFKLEIMIPDRYPFEPPHVKFLTPIYHPNIDTGGRICLDVLKMPPKGNWKPSSNIRTVLLSIQLLMNEPNPDDPLMEDISQQYKSDRQKFKETAENWTRRYAAQPKVDSDQSDAVVFAADKNDEKENRLSSKTVSKGAVLSNRASKSGVAPTSSSLVTSNAHSSTSQTPSNRLSSASSKLISTSEAPSNSSGPSKALATLTKGSAKDGAADVEDAFNSSFDVDEDVGETSAKKKKPQSKGDDDSFSDMNDSDLDLFDFEESPLKKKPKKAL